MRKGNLPFLDRAALLPTSDNLPRVSLIKRQCLFAHTLLVGIPQFETAAAVVHTFAPFLHLALPLFMPGSVLTKSKSWSCQSACINVKVMSWAVSKSVKVMVVSINVTSNQCQMARPM